MKLGHLLVAIVLAGSGTALVAAQFGGDEPRSQFESQQQPGGRCGDLTEDRPDFPGALNLEDIKPDTVATYHNIEHGLEWELTIKSGPFIKQLSPDWTSVWFEADELGQATDKSLPDMGVLPYPNGCWNPVNYLTKE
jgi:hypothetical protein